MKRRKVILATILCMTIAGGTLAGCGSINEKDVRAVSTEAETRNFYKDVESVGDGVTKDFKDTVVDAICDEGEYTDDVGNTNSYSYKIPKFDADNDAAKKLNDMILADVKEVYESQLQVMKEKCSLDCSCISYEVHQAKETSIITVLVQYSYMTDDVFYFSYSYDCEKEKVVSNKELLERCNLSEDEFVNMARDKAKNAFDLEYENPGEEGELAIAKNRDRITADLPMFITKDGSLVVAIPVASLAGADYYNKLIKF